MRRIFIGLVAVAAAALVVGLASPAGAQPAPSAGSLLAGGLLNPRGIDLGPDGMLYVAEAGEGGDEQVVVDIVPGDIPEFETFSNGHTGRISRIDPATGEVTTVVDGLPSNSHPAFGTVGPTDVAFIDDQLYYLQTHGGDVWGFPGEETGIYKVNDDGTVELLADIGAFNVANPVSDVTDGVQVDIEPGGNPYSMIVVDGDFYVSDGNQNQVMRVTQDGEISRVAELSGHPVSTGITYNPADGLFYVAELGAEPFNPEDGRVVTVSPETGAVEVIASGLSALTDVGFGPNGQLYALQFGDQSPPPIPLAPFSAKVLTVNEDGSMTPVVTGFTFVTAMLFDGPKLYVLSNGLSVLGPGEVWVIDDITSVPPPPPPPPPPAAEPALPVPSEEPALAAPPAPAVSLPSTGSGGALDGGSHVSWLIVSLALFVVSLPMAVAGAWAWRRTSRQ